MRFFRVFLLSVAVVLAQTNRGSVSGSVVDASGAAVPAAEVTVRSLATNQVTVVTASAEGDFVVPALDPVEYSVGVRAAGFQAAEVKRLKVDTAGNTAVHFTLKPQAVETVVEVSAEGAAVNTESGTVGHTISQRDILNTPLANRNVLELVMAMPNISGDVGSEDPTVTAAEYDAWARFNGKPLSSTTAGAALFNQARNVVLNSRNSAGVLPDSFFSVPVPQGFARANALGFDITQVEQFKLYRLRQAFRDTFGQLWSLPSPRQVQMSVRICF